MDRVVTLQPRLFQDDLDKIVRDLRTMLAGWGKFNIHIGHPLTNGRIYSMESLVPRMGKTAGSFDIMTYQDGHTQLGVTGVAFRTTFAVFTLTPGSVITYKDDRIEIRPGGLQVTWGFTKYEV